MDIKTDQLCFFYTVPNWNSQRNFMPRQSPNLSTQIPFLLFKAPPTPPKDILTSALQPQLSYTSLCQIQIKLYTILPDKFYWIISRLACLVSALTPLFKLGQHFVVTLISCDSIIIGQLDHMTEKKNKLLLR